MLDGGPNTMPPHQVSTALPVVECRITFLSSASYSRRGQQTYELPLQQIASEWHSCFCSGQGDLDFGATRLVAEILRGRMSTASP